MPELLLELFSEEIPARMQARGAEDLARLVTEALAPLSPADPRPYAGPRRIALGMTVAAGLADNRSSERGPRVTAPEQALAGFLRKHGAVRDELAQEGDFWVLQRAVPGIAAAALIAREMPGVLRKFPWPKSMRWGGTSRFTWVRPLRRILCILDGAVVGFDLRDGEDDGHGLASGNLTEGHRFLSPGAFPVGSEAEWRDGLLARHVIVDAAERRLRVWDGVVAKAAERGLSVVEDAGLLDEVAGLVEWPVPLLGRIDAAYMDLPPEVMQVSMRVNQRYFALRNADGRAAPWFAFAANIATDDGGAAIVAGNERVLRARFSDARYFWDLDRTRTLESRVEDLRSVTFHAKIGTQYKRALRLQSLSKEIAERIGVNFPEYAQRAGLLAKADLTSGMVGEFPELQGIMGGYYAAVDGEHPSVVEAVRTHYAPRGPSEAVPTEPTSIAVALADKLDQLVEFFRVGERPTGSGDQYALRRAALGLIRVIIENDLSLRLSPLLKAAGSADSELQAFLFDRLRVLLRATGARYDVLAAVLREQDDDIRLVLRRTTAVTRFLATSAGADLLTLYRRATNILRIEEANQRQYEGNFSWTLFESDAEWSLGQALEYINTTIAESMAAELYESTLQKLSTLRDPVDCFFSEVTVNAENPIVRENRLKVLSALRGIMHYVADFSKIEG